MKDLLKLLPLHKASFVVCLVVSLGLIIGGFFVPPMGIIDGSVITSTGVLFTFAALGIAGHNLDIGKGAKITHGDTEIEFRDNEQTV